MNGLAAYKENSVLTASKAGLVVKLYEGAIKFLAMGVDEALAGHPDKKGEYIGRAMAIIEELDTSLDMRAGGEIAHNLHELYIFMNTHLAKACIMEDVGPLREVAKLLRELNEGWKAISG